MIQHETAMQIRAHTPAGPVARLDQIHVHAPRNQLARASQTRQAGSDNCDVSRQSLRARHAIRRQHLNRIPGRVVHVNRSGPVPVRFQSPEFFRLLGNKPQVRRMLRRNHQSADKADIRERQQRPRIVLILHLLTRSARDTRPRKRQCPSREWPHDRSCLNPPSLHHHTEEPIPRSPSGAS